ncbi:MAG: hypothetical protein AMXMBFR74_32950 [Parvibaculum sp.]
MTMHDVGLQPAQELRDLANVGDVAETGQARHGNEMKAKAALSPKFCEGSGGALVLRLGTDDTDGDASFLLSGDEVAHMTEKAAHRQPHDMDDLPHAPAPAVWAAMCGGGHQK